QEALPLPNRNAPLQEEGAHLIDDAGALADQPLAYSMQGLQVELIGGLRCYELHRRSLHRLGNRFCIAKVILLTFGIRPNVLRWHQPGIVAERFKPATEMMRTDTGLHAD